MRRRQRNRKGWRGPGVRNGLRDRRKRERGVSTGRGDGGRSDGEIWYRIWQDTRGGNGQRWREGVTGSPKDGWKRDLRQRTFKSQSIIHWKTMRKKNRNPGHHRAPPCVTP